MSARDKKLALIGLLLSVAAGGAWRQWDSVFGERVVTSLPSTGDIPINDGLKIRTIGGEVWHASNVRNLFAFERVVSSVPQPEPFRPLEPPPLPPIDEGRKPEIVVDPPPPTPPTLQPIPLLYTGFARDSSNRMIAFLSTTGAGVTVGHYNLQEKDFLLGRYRVNRITSAAVEVEDIDRAETAPDRRRAIPISPTLAPKP